MLARALQVKKATHTIHMIKDPKDNTLAAPEDIADQAIDNYP